MTGESLDDLLGFGSPRVPAMGPGGAGGLGPAPGSPDLREGVGPMLGGLQSVPVASIRPNSFQPRVSFDEDGLDELAASIGELGVLQPLLVRRIDESRYELIAGERRWRAAQRAGLSHVPVLVRSVSDRESLEQAVVENLHRADLNALEEAAAYRQLVDEFLLNQEDVARRVGKSRAAVANTMRLLQLPVGVQVLVRSGELSAGHARALLALGDVGAQEALAARVVRDQLSVREVEELVRASVKGGSGPVKAGQTRPAGKATSALEIEQLLADRLDTRVVVTMSGARGKLVIEFADLDDLDRVYQAMVGPEGEQATF